MLDELGLTYNAELVYTALLNQRFTNIAQLASHLNLAETETKSALVLLHEFHISSSAEANAIVVSAAKAVQILLDKQESGLLELEAKLERSQKIAATFINEHELNIDSAENERVFGRERILRRLSELGANAKRQVDTFAPKAPRSRTTLDASHKANLEILNRGVFSRTIYLDSASNDQRTQDHLDWLQAHGSQVRLTRDLPIPMIIFDNKAAVLPLNISHAMEGILVVKDHSTIQALSELFELIWMHATPFGTSKNLAADGLSEDERTVLRLLNQGLNDPQVARKMGRTDPQVRYIIKSLKTKTNARSKFELGALAAKAGWLATL